MYIEAVPNKANKPAILLRESKRDNGKVVKTTLANLSHLSPEIIESLKVALKGGCLVDANNVPGITECESTVPWGHVNAVLTAMKRLNLAEIIDDTPCQERDIVLGLVAARILNPRSKLATTRVWNMCSLASELKLEEVDEKDVYSAMDWLLQKQNKIERKLAKRHLNEGDLVFLDVSSSYYEGQKSTLIDNTPRDDDEGILIRFGYSRDKKRNKPQVNYGLVTDKHGIPVSITAYPGNTSDTSIFMPTVDKIRNEFGVYNIVMTGDRGMISSKDILILKETPGVDWITALRSTSIKSLMAEEGFPLRLFDDYNLCEFTSPEFPGERLAVCRNPDLRAKREKKRDSLIEATSKNLDKIKARIEKGRLKTKEAIGLAVGKVINKHSMSKHFKLTINDSNFSYSLEKDSIESEKILDGVYVIRTSLPAEIMELEECVRQYKNLSNVERAFRTMKTTDLKIRPIYHHLDGRIRAHIFLTMLSYYVEWHLRDVWREITFADTELDIKKDRDPVAPAQRSEKALDKISTKMSSETLKAESFGTLIANLATISKVTQSLNIPNTGKKIRYQKIPNYTLLQKKAYNLLAKIPLYP